MKRLADFESAVDRFVESIELTPDGRALYARAAVDFLEFLDATPSALKDADVLLKFQKWLRARHLKPATIRFKLTAVARFLAFLRIEDLLPATWDKAVERFRFYRGRAREVESLPRPAPLPESLPPLFQVLEQRTLRAKLEIDRVRALRDLALARLLWGAGLRISEALALRVEDAFEKNGTARSAITLRGKGGRVATVPVRTDVLDALAAYRRALVAFRPRLASHSPWLFVSLGRKRFGRLSRQQAWNVLQKAGQEAGIKLFPHAFRNLLATALLRRGRSVAEVQAVLRHKSPATTLRYARTSGEDVRAALEVLQDEL